MNDRGLALVNMDLMLEAGAQGVPSQVVRRIALRSANVQDAAEAIIRLPHMSGRSYLLGDADGQVAGIEVSVSRVRTLDREADFLTHTNHALHPEMVVMEDIDELNRTYPSSRARFARLTQLAGLSPLTIDRVAAILSDHQGHPDSICKHFSDIEQTSTCLSVIFDCGKKTAHISVGGPCSNPFQAVYL
jgi:isopenicillin-N N-acyltransferase-like protein